MALDTLAQMISFGLEIVGVVMAKNDKFFIALIGFRLIVLSLRFDNIKTGIKNSRRIPKISKAVAKSKDDIS